MQMAKTMNLLKKKQQYVVTALCLVFIFKYIYSIVHKSKQSFRPFFRYNIRFELAVWLHTEKNNTAEYITCLSFVMIDQLI